jgi:hypothetical protein
MIAFLLTNACCKCNDRRIGSWSFQFFSYTNNLDFVLLPSSRQNSKLIIKMGQFSIVAIALAYRKIPGSNPARVKGF